MSDDFEKQFEDTFLSERVQGFLEKIDKAAFRAVPRKTMEDAVQMFTLAVFRQGYVEGFKARDAGQRPVTPVPEMDLGYRFD